MCSVRVEDEDKVNLEYPAGQERPNSKAPFPLPNFTSKGRSQFICTLSAFTCRLGNFPSTESEIDEILLSLRVDSPSTIMGDGVPVMKIKYVVKERNDDVVEGVEVRKKKSWARAFLFIVSFCRTII